MPKSWNDSGERAAGCTCWDSRRTDWSTAPKNHYLSLLELAARQGFTGDRVLVHAVVDGRDTAPRSAPAYLRTLQETIERLGTGRIATVSGRYYAMDRDNRWDRVRRAYDLFTAGKGNRAGSAAEAIQAAYDRGETDEFVSPTVIAATQDGPVGTMADGDAVIVFNYRADRGRQIVRAFIEEDFDGFGRETVPDVRVATMTPYDARFDVPCAFRPPEPMTCILGETISRAGRRQLRVAGDGEIPPRHLFLQWRRRAAFRRRGTG